MEENIMERTHLYVLWTNDNPVTAEKMVFMYTINSLIHSWWEKVTLIIWGAPAKLVSEDVNIQKKIKEYWGEPLTEILKNNEPLLTV